MRPPALGIPFSAEERAMYKVSVMYPFKEGARFDMDYYRTRHMKMVEEAMRPFGLVRIAVEKGLSGGAGKPAPYICIGHLYFETQDGYDRAIQANGAKLRADIPNYTDIQPIRQISELYE
jgi:uncharacterized protein (TIGR02118 family)